MKILHRIVLQYVFFIIFWYGVTTAFFFSGDVNDDELIVLCYTEKREIYTLMLVLVSSRIEQWNPKRILEFSYEENKSFTFFFVARRQRRQKNVD